MKKISITIVLCIIYQIAVAQNFSYYDSDGERKSFSYELFLECPLIECDIIGNIINEDEIKHPIEAPLGKFSYIDKLNDSFVIIKFWDWNVSTENYKNHNVASIKGRGVSKSEKKYYLMRQSDFQTKTYKLMAQNAVFTAGIAIIPIKMRFDPFNFSKDVTLGFTAGAKFRISQRANNFINVLGGIGITSVNLDSSSTEGKISNSNRPALTPSLGAVFEFNHNAQVGVFIGMDLLSSSENINWAYHAKPWLSIGIGYSIFSQSSSPKSSSASKTNASK